MNKEEAKAIVRKNQAEIRHAEIMMEMYKNGVRERKEHIAKIEEFINKKDNWRLIEVADEWHHLYREKAYLMADMMKFAHARNDGWVPDWEDSEAKKWGLIADAVEGIYLYSYFNVNTFIFGITVKSQEIAQEMLEEFGERIEKVYNKQY